MILRLARRVLGSRAERMLEHHRRAADRIIALASEHRAMPSAALLDRAADLRQQATAGTPLPDITTATFALVREAARRTIGEEHVLEQIIAGLALQDGCIAEMKTGEGKTLAATLVCALNAFTGRGVHIATPNDYLAERDARWMRPVFEALGLSVGVITPQMDDGNRRSAYACDVTYGVASEFGFDYLRDNMKFSAAEQVQRGHAFALVDEADAVLIDEAGMPLSLFGSIGDQSGFYQSIDSIIASLSREDYEIDDRRRVALTDAGYDVVERELRRMSLLKTTSSLHNIESISLLHHAVQALRAHALLARDRDYIVQDGTIVIIDKLTGRMTPGRRYDDGLHQALEAKEHCAIGEETRTLASITFQTFFQRYDRLAGMTGTAAPDANEYRQIYGLEVFFVPTHRPLIRTDETITHPTAAEKMRAILLAVEEAHARQQPVLIGATSIEQSENLAALLESGGWTQSGHTSAKTFAVLNAKYHADEAHIIAQAGMPGAVTIATAMAGRGTDIRLGGAQKDKILYDRVVAAGGLLVIGSEHHDHCRLDDQLRGRAGRQGDPGRSVFYASLEDNLLKHRIVSQTTMADSTFDPPAAQRLVRSAQMRNETRSFDGRLGLLRFDTVIERQRETIYEQRRAIRDDPEPLVLVKRLRDDTIDDLIAHFAPDTGAWDAVGLDEAVRSILTLSVPIPPPSVNPAADTAQLRERIAGAGDRWMQGKIDRSGADAIGTILRRVMMALLDQLWTEQSERLEFLKRMIGDRRLPPLKAAAEFQIEAFALFDLMMKDFRHEVTAHAMRLGAASV